MKIHCSRLLLVLLILATLLLVKSNPALAQADKPPRITVSSPIHLNFEISCKDVASVQVVIDDEKRDIIARQIFIPDCKGRTTQTIQTKLYFDTFERLTPAHLSISAFDEETRLIWLVSDNIVFTDLKTPMIYSFETKNPLSIALPVDRTTIAEQIFTVKGSIRVETTRSAYFELISDTGRVLGSALLNIPSNVTNGQWDFEFPFEIISSDYTGGARLTMQQYGLDIYGIESLASVNLLMDQ